MSVKYEYVIYIPGLETPHKVADEGGTMNGDEAIHSMRDAIHCGVAQNVEIARREIGTLDWHDIPEAY